jgi:hypothetical protein
MDEKQLNSIEHFTIYNEHGLIEFEGTSDVTFQNLDNIVDINEGIVNKIQEKKKTTNFSF